MNAPAHRHSDQHAVKLDLRTGVTLWEQNADEPSAARPLVGRLRTEIVIVGAGITGAFIAERLTRAGRDVVVLDRHDPQRASTAASTSLLQWEIDASMLELEDRLGFETAAGIYRRSIQTVQGLGRLIGRCGGNCDFAQRQTVFLAGTELDAADLRQEHRLRELAGIPGRYLTSGELASGFGFEGEAALVYGGSAEANPVKLAKMLLDSAIRRGARVVSPAQVTGYDCDHRGVSVETSDGNGVDGKILVLANGYEMPPFIRTGLHKIVSTWVVATAPQPPQALWPGPALVWEASDPYCYMRTAMEGRIIIGGEDEDVQDPAVRDRLAPGKVSALLRKLLELVPCATPEIDASWSGFFGETDDGLPLIGRVPGLPRCFVAFGYGGNGITFSALAAEMMEGMIAGVHEPAADWFAIDR